MRSRLPSAKLKWSGELPSTCLYLAHIACSLLMIWHEQQSIKFHRSNPSPPSPPPPLSPLCSRLLAPCRTAHHGKRWTHTLQSSAPPFPTELGYRLWYFTVRPPQRHDGTEGPASMVWVLSRGVPPTLIAITLVSRSCHTGKWTHCMIDARRWQVFCEGAPSPWLRSLPLPNPPAECQIVGVPPRRQRQTGTARTQL